MKMKETIATLISLFVLGGFIWGGANYFAKASDLELVELRLDQKIRADTIQQMQQRAWQLEDRNGGGDESKWINQSDKDEYRKVKSNIEDLKKNQELRIKSK